MLSGASNISTNLTSWNVFMILSAVLCESRCVMNIEILKKVQVGSIITEITIFLMG